MGRLRVRFWVGLALAILATLLLLVTLISREWIEIVFRVDPDGGDGSLEWVIVGVLAGVEVVSTLTASAEWRRRAALGS